MTEDSILTRIASGQADAVEACIDQYGGLVWSLARRLTTSQSEAEDAVQEIFVEIWRNADRFDSSIASESTFIAMLARRRLIDRLRKTKRDATGSLENVELQSAEDISRDLEISDEANRALEQVRRLPPDQRGDRQRRNIRDLRRRGTRLHLLSRPHFCR